jgi:6-pyruvoyl-tetrahydropterin synthase
VFDFGGMKPIKEWLHATLDHTHLVAHDDPSMEKYLADARYSRDPYYNGLTFEEGCAKKAKELGVESVTMTHYEQSRDEAFVFVPAVGCEATAEYVYKHSLVLLEQMKNGEIGRYSINQDVKLVSVECFEHEGNSAIYYG